MPERTVKGWRDREEMEAPAYNGSSDVCLTI